MRHQTTRVAFLSLFFAVLTPLAIGKFENPITRDPRNQIDETIYLDMRVGQPGPVSTSSPLEDGALYLITVTGTWSAWYENTWSNYCGEPEEQPETPSPGVTNGKVGVDARYVFAAPVGYYWCGRGDDPPWLRDNYPFEVSVDGGSTWQVVEPLHEGYHPNHQYTFRVDGRGFAPQFRLRDPNMPGDNYGILKIAIKPSCPADQWSAQYFNNADLSGEAVFHECVSDIDHY